MVKVKVLMIVLQFVFQLMDLWRLKHRVDNLYKNHKDKPYQVRSKKLQQECESFLNNIGSSRDNCTPYDLCLFLTWKDSKEKLQFTT